MDWGLSASVRRVYCPGEEKGRRTRHSPGSALMATIFLVLHRTVAVVSHLNNYGFSILSSLVVQGPQVACRCPPEAGNSANSSVIQGGDVCASCGGCGGLVQDCNTRWPVSLVSLSEGQGDAEGGGGLHFGQGFWRGDWGVQLHQQLVKRWDAF